MAVTTRARFCRLSFVRFPSYVGRVVRNNRTKTCGRGAGYKKRDQPASVRPSTHHPVRDEVVTRCVFYYLIEKHEILNFHSDLCIEIFSGGQLRTSRVYVFIYGLLMALRVPRA